jgi:hypothetical protein
VQVKGDTAKEDDETFFLDLSGAVNAVVALPRATGVILGDESNSAPVANAGADQTVQATSNSGASVQLNGSGSSDPDGDSLTFTWTGPFGTVQGQSPTVTVPIGINNITLTVDDNFGGSATDTVTVTVTDFILTADPPSRTVTAGQSATFTITGMPQFGPYNSSVTLSCAGMLPRGVSCSFSPSNMLTPGANGSSVTLTVNTTATSFAELRVPSEHQPAPPFYALWLGLLGLGVFGLALSTGPHGKRRLAVLVLGLVLGMAATLAGCGGGGGSSGPTVIPGTPTGTHAISISATSGSLQRGVDIQLIVQ